MIPKPITIAQNWMTSAFTTATYPPMNTYAPKASAVMSLHQIGSMPNTNERYVAPPVMWLPSQMISAANIVKPMTCRTIFLPP